MRTLIRISFGAFALFGSLMLMRLAWTFHAKLQEPNSSKVYQSPDGEFKAVLATWYGGGAISPYCRAALVVLPIEAQLDKVDFQTSAIFSAECASFALQDGIMESSPKISWKSERLLHVEFSTSAGPRSSIQLRTPEPAVNMKVEFEGKP
ncbi:hypothetical protein [Rhizobium etli]|uniref:hypothetical protein n=1 Tax=Rhizobium etli TaxID=29449 RepID=UPI0005A28AE5|nr:hypothetical protein [Rhizobium etli]